MKTRLTFIALLIGLVLTFPVSVMGDPYEPGQLLRLSYETAEGVRPVAGLPALDKASVSTYPAGSDGKIEVTVDPSPGDVTISMKIVEGDIKRMGAALYAADDEVFCGLLERVVDGDQGASWRKGMTEALDLRGQKVEMFVKPTLGLYAPFHLSTGGYGVFVEGTWPGDYDLAAAHPNEVRFLFEGPIVRFHILRADTPMGIISKYGSLAGTTILPPRWVFRPWRWRDDHTQRNTFWDGTPASKYFNTEIVEDILMMDALNIPCGVYWVDRPWAKGHQGYEDFEWDRERLPHPEEMIEWIGSRDQKFLLWIAPWVLGDMVNEGQDKGYFLKTKGKANRLGLMDFTNPDAVAWWQGYLKKVIDDGVAGFKLDRAEEIVPAGRDQRTFSGLTAREMHNDYPRLYTKAVYDVMKRLRGDDFVLMPRAGYTGSQQYAVFWGGDTGSTAWGLRSAIIALQRSAVLGFAVWGSDTGGYHRHEYNRETTARWLGFSAFCPLMEVGPTKNSAFWCNPWEPIYDAELLAMWSVYARVHDRIGDYLYALASRANQTGEPIARPLFVQFPDDSKCAAWWDEYTLGDDILVCPVWAPGATERTVYLPAGEWQDPWEKGRVLTGPGEVKVSCPLHKIPVYVRKGSAVDLGDLAQMYAESLEHCRTKPDMGELVKKAGLK